MSKDDIGKTKSEKIIDLYKIGKNYKEIEKITGFKYNSIFVIIRKHIIFESAKKGLTPKQISIKTGSSEDFIIWRLNN